VKRFNFEYRVPETNTQQIELHFLCRSRPIVSQRNIESPSAFKRNHTAVTHAMESNAIYTTPCLKKLCKFVFVKFPPILIFSFTERWLKVCEMHSFSTSP